jgi:Cu+-exporting ATPase
MGTSAVTDDEVTPAALPHSVELDLTGMTCAACAQRIERKLNRLDGVEATVNYATEKARIRYTAPGEQMIPTLIHTVEAVGYGAAVADRSTPPVDRTEALRTRLILAMSGGLIVILLSMIPAMQFPGWQWVALVIATPVATWAAWPFHRSMVMNLRHGQATMDTLISVGVSAAYLWSLWALVFTGAGEIGMKMPMSLTGALSWGGDVDHGGDHGAEHSGAVPHIYLEVASTVVAFLLAGRYFEARAKQRAGDALRALIDLGAKDVWVMDPDGVEHQIPVEDLVVGDHFVVRPGEKIATDGLVIEGASAVDMSLVTGESLPVDVGPGSTVIGATVNSGGGLSQGRLIVKATRIGADTQLSQMARLVEEAQSGKAPVQRLADRVSAVFVPVVIVISLTTMVTWWILTSDIERSFAASVAVLIIACPCALGLATPTGLLVGTGRGAQLGILIRGPEILESTRRVDTIVLDKTGTVTTGTMSVASVHPAPGVEAEELLRLAGALETASEHPIARAIVRAAQEQNPLLAPVTQFVNLPGVGVSGEVEGRSVRITRAQTGVEDLEPGHTGVEIWESDRSLGVVAVADSIKEKSAAAVKAMREIGLTPVLLSGDREATAQHVAHQVGITDVRAEVAPADKVAAIRDLQSSGAVVAMVGDGVNDAAALAQADLGIAMGSGTDVAIEASDLTLVRDDLMAAVDAIRLSRRTLSTIKGNLFWAFAYNTAAIPLATLGLLSPVIAGGAMAFSSVFVVTNSLRLKRFSPTT